MNLEDRIEAFGKLGERLSAIDTVTLNTWIDASKNENAWFTPEGIKLALEGLKRFLIRDNLPKWTSNYVLSPTKPKTIAVIMAGNIPLVGFHDFLAVLISGHCLQYKPSSKDSALLRYLIDALMDIEPRFRNFIRSTELLKNFDAVIATGSDNTSRYFEYYFDKYPHIIRKNRNSCAILSGFETEEELYNLGSDVFTYFGLGCRNVSKLYVPVEYDFGHLIKSWTPYQHVMLHHKYHNNYDYQKSILLINREAFLDTGFVLFQESERLASPISVVYYEYYHDWNSLLKKIDKDKDKTQCLVGNVKPATINLGQAQFPELWDYADQVDTLKFLESLN